MIEYLRGTLRRKPLIGVVFSIAIHAVLLLLLIGVHPSRPAQKRGDALIVELPNPQESARAGTPGPQVDAPLVPARPGDPAGELEVTVPAEEHHLAGGQGAKLGRDGSLGIGEHGDAR